MAERERNEMPGDVRQILLGEDLMDACEGRPRYQRNDYLGWIGQAKRPQTSEDRLEQMLGELRRGGIYMNMSHPPSARP